ncbi:MetQ/NlpA family ABC transporter substrate-binding protein, partial [Burkholderia stabilis]
MKRIARFVSVWLLAACGVVQHVPVMAAESAAPAVRVGVTRGVHAQIMDEVKRVAASRGFGVDVVEFDDASRIDAALADGRIDAASFEDAQQLAATRAQQRHALTEVAPTVTLPMALYSRKLKSLNELQPGAMVAIPADPRGMARALVLLQNDTLVTLREKAGLHATLRDVTGNRLGLKLVTLRRDRLYAALDTAAFVAI